MSLLWMDYEAEFDNLVDTANQYEMEDNPEYFAKLTKRIKKIVYRDTRYNVDFLYTAYVLKDEKIIEDYAVWLYQLMASVLKDRTRIQSMEYVIKHLNYIKKALEQTVSQDKISNLQHLIECAQNSIRAQVPADNREEAEKKGIDYAPTKSAYESDIQEYMEALFRRYAPGASACSEIYRKRNTCNYDLRRDPGREYEASGGIVAYSKNQRR